MKGVSRRFPNVPACLGDGLHLLRGRHLPRARESSHLHHAGQVEASKASCLRSGRTASVLTRIMLDRRKHNKQHARQTNVATRKKYFPTGNWKRNSFKLVGRCLSPTCIAVYSIKFILPHGAASCKKQEIGLRICNKVSPRVSPAPRGAPLF